LLYSAISSSSQNPLPVAMSTSYALFSAKLLPVFAHVNLIVVELNISLFKLCGTGKHVKPDP
jgi:hypothetical protein